MKTQSIKMLESIIRKSLHTNQNKLINEQAIPTPAELEKIKKYSYESNIKTPADAKEFRTWVRVNHQSEMMDIGLVSQEKFNTLEPTEQAKQKKLLKTAWKTYGKEYLGGSDGVDVETKTDWLPYGIIGAIILFTIVGVIFGMGRFKRLQKYWPEKEYKPNWFQRRRMKAYRSKLTIEHAHLSRAQVDELVNIMFDVKDLNNAARRVSFEKRLTEMTNMSADDAKRLTSAIAENPAAQNEITLTYKGIAADNFIENRGFTEDKLKQVFSPQEVKAIKAKKATKTVKTKKPTVKTPTTAVTLKNMGKLKGTVGQQWANFQNAGASADDILNATRKSINSEVGLKTRIEIQNTVQKKLNTKLGSKQGSWVLTKHLKSSTFPDFTKWAMDVKSAGVTRKLTDFDYFVSKTLWNLAK